ncbi:MULTISPECIES: hypothetical protein [Burkholderiaceae]|uniref:hypothetical protein n=1 Tax=Burkholderiaceae TaxID=119060 RepID=UPI00097663B4|nr:MULTISPECIES: hypothetical protein [Burkholderiaceae]MCG1038412.1 hypothetical protein [Mycetohabitans sp. B7]
MARRKASCFTVLERRELPSSTMFGKQEMKNELAQIVCDIPNLLYCLLGLRNWRWMLVISYCRDMPFGIQIG